MNRLIVPWMVPFGLLSISLPAAAQEAEVAGTVYDSLAGAPLAGARVWLAGTDLGATTDAAGAFRIAGVEAGDEYGVLFEHPRLEGIGWMPDTAWTAVAAEGDTRVELAIPSMLRLAVLGCRGEGEAGTSVAAGRVADAATGAPIPGARVSISWAGAAPEGLDPVGMAARVRTEAVADAEGRWYACDLPQGVTVVARVDQPGYQRQDVSYLFEAPSAVHADFRLARGGRGERTFLTGRVVGQASGAPLQGAVVSVEGTGLSTTSDELGLWELAGVPPGERMLRVRHAGAERSVPVRVPEGTVADVEIRVPPDAYTLAPLTVTAMRDRGVLQGFYHRREKGAGQYLTRSEIQRRGALVPTDLLSAMMRGAERCGPYLYLDGVFVREGIDVVSVSEVEGVEYYPTGSSVPVEFLRGPGNCAVFAVWTRRGGTRLDEEP